MFKSPRDSCLFEAEKIGLELVYDPPALANRCFYRCIARCLSLKEDDLIGMVEKSMLEKQFLPVKNEVRANLFFNCYFAHANLQTTCTIWPSNCHLNKCYFILFHILSIYIVSGRNQWNLSNKHAGEKFSDNMNKFLLILSFSWRRIWFALAYSYVFTFRVYYI